MQQSTATVVPLRQQVDDEAFRRVADALPQIVWVANTAGAAEYFNQMWFDYTGLDLADSLSSNRWKLAYHADDITALRERWEHSLATGEDFDVEFRIRRTDGVYRWFLCRGMPMRDEAGTVVRWFGTLTDIDDKIRTEQQLRDQTEFLRSILDTSTDCIKVVDRLGRLVTMNAGGMKIMEIPDFSMCELKEWASFWTGEHHASAQQAFDKALRGETISFEGACNTFAGTPKWWHVMLTPIAEPAGQIERVLIVSRDITEQRRRDDQFRQLADAMPQKVWVCRADGYTEYYNKRWYDFTGLNYDSTKGAGWKNVFHPDDQDEAWKRWEHSLATGEPYEIEYRLRRHDGEYRWMLGRALPIYDDQGKIERWFGTCTDIHDRILSGLLMQQALEQAETTGIAKTDFLAHMSHEIRTPMNAVIGLANILNGSEPLTEQQKDYVSTLQVSAKQLMALINDLLDMSRLESNAVQLETIPFDFNAMVREVMSIARVGAREKHIALHISGTCPQPLVGDPLRLRQILLNLVGNAVKFTDEGSVTVEVKATPRNGAFDLILAVQDTGIGIASDKLEQIFERYSQADNSTARRFGGSGLGLTIAKTLTELMGGTIAATSTPGKGARFTVALSLPALYTKPDTTAPAPKATVPAPMSESNKRILLVEDYHANVLVATMLLENFSYAYDVATSGEEALIKLAERDYAVVLMDVQMPKMNGYQATAAVREREAGKARRTPVVGMTAHALKGDRERCIEAGMDDYISKPFRPETLKETLEHYCSAHADAPHETTN